MKRRQAGRITDDRVFEHLGRVCCELIACRQRLRVLAEENAALRACTNELSAFMRLAYRDPLTGLRNRRYFETRLREEIERSRRSGTVGLSLLVIDIDDFKSINDTRGHTEGDRYLKWVARFLERNLRHHDVCCRTGGDEFAVILPETDRTHALDLVQRLRGRLSAARARGPQPVTLSIGAVTLLPREAADEFFRRADLAMYEDKSWHRDCRAPAEC